MTNTLPTAGRLPSGPVEGACKNLIKDRMERSGILTAHSSLTSIVTQH
jgi:hypothetical protein